MRDQSQELLRSVFGYEHFRGPQKAIIDALLAGHDALVLMPTGGGKSLCYQIPAILKRGTGIVISPLIALMQDQVHSLVQSGVKAAYLNSSQNLEEVQQIERALFRDELDLLYIAPERLNTERTLNLLKRIPINLFAIDEAHCVSQWGHDFRSDYLQLSQLHAHFPDTPRIALTATADTATRQEIIQRLGLDQAKVFISGFDRPNIRYRIVQKQNARQQLLHFIRQEHPNDSGVVYCLSRKKVDDVAAWLCAQGYSALPYHAGMTQEQRRSNQQKFLMADDLIMVATIAFGMGIDKPNVRFVAHLDLPKSIEAYYQETGRAGRDGLAADAWMAYGLQDVIMLRQMVETSGADELRKRIEVSKLEAMLALCEQVNCRRQTLLSYFGDTIEQPCGNCDTCLDPVETWDASIPAQQALSCIYRTGQQFGVNYLIDVLLGKSNERILSHGHNQVSTYGIGKGIAEAQWRSIFRQLIARNLVAIDFSAFGALKLTSACRPVLKGQQNLMLRKELIKNTQAANQKYRTQSSSRVHDSGLWEALRAKRRELAEAEGVPPYVVFHDATLMAIMEAKPRTLEQLSHLSGIGQRKLDRYGQSFLDVLDEFRPGPNEKIGLSDTVAESVALFRLGYALEQIAKQRQLKLDTIYVHMAEAIQQGTATLREVIELPETTLNEIHDALLELVNQENISLKPVFEQFGAQYSYGILRCIRADIIRELRD